MNVFRSQVISFIKQQGLLLLVLVASLFVRFYEPGRHGLWVDELMTAFYSAFPQENQADSHTPFYYWLTNLSVRIFGLSELSVRLVSLMSSGMLLVFVFCYQWLKKEKIYTYFFLLLAFFPCDLFLAREARMYALVFLFSTLALFVGQEFSEQASRRKLIFFFLILVLMNLTHAMSMVFSFVLCLYLIGGQWLRERKFSWSLGLGFSLSLIPTLFYYFSGEHYALALKKTEWILPPDSSWPLRLFQFFAGEKFPNGKILSWPEFYFLLFVLVGVVFTGCIHFFVLRKGENWKVKLKSFYLSTFGLILPFLLFHLIMLSLLFFGISLFNPIYFISLLPFVLLVFAYALVIMQKKWISFVVVVLIAIHSLLFTSFFREQVGIREYLQTFVKSSGPSTLKIICDYGKLIQAQALLYPERFGELAYCYQIDNVIEQMKPYPYRISLYWSGPGNNKAGIESFLKKNYEMVEEKKWLPEEATMQIYQLKDK